MAPRVLIADELSPAAVAIFKERGVEVDVKTGLSKDAFPIAIIDQYDGLAVRSATKPNKDVIAKAKNLKVIGRAGIGVDNVDIPAATAAGIVVMNTPFGNSITTAEHAIAMMFALARQLPQADLSTQAGKWEKNRFMGVEVYSKTLGLIGAGNIGSIVRRSRAQGLKMKVVAYDPFLSAERAVEMGVEKVDASNEPAGPRRLHHPAHPADRQDPQHPRQGRPGQGQEGRADRQLRPRRPGGRSRPCATALDSGHCRRRGLRRVHGRSRPEGERAVRRAELRRHLRTW